MFQNPICKVTCFDIISDFRDLVLSRSRFGMWLTSFYYQALDPEKDGGRRPALPLLAVPAVMIFVLGLVHWKRRKSRQTSHPPN